jgi:hypothetical protein
MMKLAIHTCATAGYTYALTAQARRLQSALRVLPQPYQLAVHIVHEGNAEADAAVTLWQSLLPEAHVEGIIDARFVTGHANYQPPAQLVIAQMRTAAVAAARAWDADYCLTLDSDVLPAANSLRCMLDALRFDAGYYGVAACPYPSQGGGDFLCGRGTSRNPILPDFDESEKDIPADLITARDLAKEAWQAAPHDPALRDAFKSADEAIRNLPPRGNVFEMNAKEWRRRGWFSAAYPAIGKGAMVPTDWCGFGCTLMNREALALCDWSGYDGQGTEDLFICWHRWHPAGLRIAALPHCPADHVVRTPADKQKLVHCFTGHEGEGECVGHLRQQRRPWYAHDPGETHAPGNDGQLH